MTNATHTAPERLERWLELKADEADTGVIEGYAAIFGERDRGGDIIMPRAFSKSLRERKSTRIPMLFGHMQQHMPVGVWESMMEDSVGLRVKGRLILESQEARQLHAVMKAKAEIGISIGYKTVKADYVEQDGEMTRQLVEVDLYETSLVTIPMQDNARVLRVKSADQAAAEQVAALEAKAAADAIRALNDHTTVLEIKMALASRRSF